MCINIPELDDDEELHCAGSERPVVQLAYFKYIRGCMLANKQVNSGKA
jgi:hypothetical protein